ncbi:MAG: formate dehydrogenase accessory sulfurtransferase FdhD [Woeseiaceae bacterium]|nr:formate dehydrogenase accessory sulfurtransferase FdhD [Woeseiaceae bacterium]NIP21838.1 formate dehydrogenase accessory sulfurtransferase FdhD [Woeseiaceae bacterium]NIS90923.1 formate dehydrogenase accessory sulfurtransferase FdhD [Woeseiaceae bacterium]
MAGSSHAVDIHRFRNGKQASQSDTVAVEEPLEIRLAWSTPDGRATRSVSITMRTPGNDEELAVGFLVSESLIRGPADFASVESCGPPAPDSGNHNVIRVDLAANVDVDLGRLQRHFYTTSSCGVCGKASLDALRVIGVESQVGNTARFERSVLTSIPDKLRAAQTTFDETGGLHAAAAFTQTGDLVVTREDVGRHNAVDKVIGALLLRNQLPATELGLMVSGRASFELMQKTVVAGMPLLAAVSAPSSLAVELAGEFGVTLVGFLRGDTFNVYAGEERICE